MQKRRKFWVKGTMFLILLLGLAFIQEERVEASSRVIKVGYFPMSGYHELIEDGSRFGYGYEYLQELSKYLDATFEYVDASYTECLEMLAKGEIDILTCAKKANLQEDLFDYTEYSIGTSHMMLTAREDDTYYHYNEFKEYNGKTIGVCQSTYAQGYWEIVCRQQGITGIVKNYATETQMVDALQNNEIDLIFSNNYRIMQQEKVVAQFEPVPFYIMVKKGENEILSMLNQALREHLIRNPSFGVTLYEKYYGENRGYSLALSKTEADFIAEKKTIRAVVGTPLEPLYYQAGGQTTGVVADVIQKIAQNVGLEVIFIESDSYENGMAMVKNGQADILCEMYADYGWAEENDLLLTTPYLSVRYMAITSNSNPETKVKVATCRDYFFNQIYIYKHYGTDQINYYDTETDCVDAVLKGEASVAYVNEYLAEYLLGQDKYLPLKGTSVMTSDHELGIAVNNEEKLLCGILDKAIANLQQNDVEEIIEEHTSNQNRPVSLKSFIYYNTTKFMWMAITVFLLIILCLTLVLRQVRKNSVHIYRMAYIDEKTGLHNRKWLEEEGYKGIEGNKNKKYFLLAFDVSKFSVINETYGRDIGDETIAFVARKMLELVENTGVVVRNTGDRFFVLKSYKDKAEIERFIISLRSRCGVYENKNREIGLIFNCGVYMMVDGVSIQRAIDMSEMARKQAKADRGYTRFYDEVMEAKVALEKSVEDSMADALADEEFVPFYQPKYDMLTGEIIGAEALVRWISKKRGFLSPDQFIPIFESNGFVVEMDFCILDKVCKFLQEQIEKGRTPVTVSVNQSRLHFLQDDYLQRLDEIIEKHKVPKKFIELEITETTLANTENIGEIMKELKRRGYKLSIDDFGSGFSSLNTLTEYTFDTLKIDRSFLHDKEGDGRNRKVIQKVVELAEELNLGVICKGVELTEQIEFLKSVGCYNAQGFFYAKPMPVEEYEKLFLNGDNA